MCGLDSPQRAAFQAGDLTARGHRWGSCLFLFLLRGFFSFLPCLASPVLLVAGEGRAAFDTSVTAEVTGFSQPVTSDVWLYFLLYVESKNPVQ